MIRAYAAMIAQQTTGDASATGTAGIIRAFIQFAGLTAGHAVSYFDFFNSADYGYTYSLWGATTGVLGTDLIAYTWRIGNGWSASISLEDGGTGTTGGRTKRVINAGLATGNFVLTSATMPNAPGITASSQSAWTPDITGNIRVDQAWGSAQLSAALHNMSGSYYSSSVPLAIGAAPSTQFGHPDDNWGWAIQAGFRLTNVFQPRNRFEASAYYCDGATAYCVSYPVNAPYGSGNTIGMGYAVDGVFVNGSSIEKTESWGVQAAFEHFWNAQWRTGVSGGYTEVNYNQTATAMICGVAGSGGLATGQYAGVVFAPGSVCSPSFSQYAIGTRTAWKPHPMLEIGLDLVWYHLNTAHSGTAVLPAVGSRPGGTYAFEDQDRFLSVLRVQKTVLP